MKMHDNFSRREFVGVAAAATLSTVTSEPAGAAPTPETIDLALTINGESKTFHIEPRVTLLDLLREKVYLTGTKKGCDHGQCGACTVLSNGVRINSCLALAVTQDGNHITTIEGMASGNDLHPMQAAFIEHDGFQCGFCTSGQICSAIAMLREPHTSHLLGDAEIRERMSGNICRCGAYPNIVAAIRHVQRQAVHGSAE